MSDAPQTPPAQIIPIAPETMAGKTWNKIGSYWFAAGDTACELSISEASKASANLPMAFMRNDNGDFTLVAVQGFQPQENVLVSAEGHWHSNYVPANYRFHPFTLAQNDKDQLVLCFNNSHNQLRDDNNGEGFFEDSGELAPLLGNVFKGLVDRWNGLKQAQSIAKQLNELDLIIPWDIQFPINDQGIRVQGFYRIDEEQIAQLSAEQLIKLRDCGGLALAYCQMISMNHLSYLQRLKAELSGSDQAVGLSDFNLGGSQDDGLNFDNL
jgi:hypothetical protein